MKLHYNATGPDRKELVAVISKTIGMKPVYKGMPTCAYAVNNILVEKDGTVVYDERTDQDTIEAIIIALAAAGFHAETGTDKEEGPTGVAIQMPLIQMPLSIFTESQLQNLYDLVAAKGSLIKKALGVSELPINIEDKKLDFPWFPKYESPDEVKAYTHFIASLGKMSRDLKRISATEKEVDNEKYAFRCFLLRLGFIGNEYKAERKILLKNLSGNSSWKNAAPEKEVAACE